MAKAKVKLKRSKRSKDSLRSLLVTFLRSIPQSSQKTKSIKAILGSKYKVNKQAAEALVLFLQFFNVLTIKTVKGDMLLKAKSDSAAFFIESFALYLEKNKSLISNWVGLGASDERSPDEIFTWGTQFLHLMEDRRVKKLRIKDHLDEVDIALLFIKAMVEGSDEPMFLFQYNQGSLHFQLIGGYKKDSDKDPKSSIHRHISEELRLNKLDPRKDFKIDKIFKDIVNYGISVKRGVYSQYTLSLFAAEFSVPKIKLSSTDRWISLNEIKGGITVDGVPIKSPLDDVSNREQFVDLLESLPLSLADKQKASKASFKTASAPKAKGVSKLKQYLFKEESSQLEFKSSARWDFNQEIVNKGLEKVIVKSIAGFLNSNGGTLLIGVSDDKEILGLRNDIDTLKRKDEDGYMQYLIGLISSYLGIEFCAFVNISFESQDEKVVCILEVNKAPQPVFMKEGERREFYVRAGNTSRQLNPEEVYKYIHLHW